MPLTGDGIPIDRQDASIKQQKNENGAVRMMIDRSIADLSRSSKTICLFSEIDKNHRKISGQEQDKNALNYFEIFKRSMRFSLDTNV